MEMDDLKAGAGREVLPHGGRREQVVGTSCRERRGTIADSQVRDWIANWDGVPK